MPNPPPLVSCPREAWDDSGEALVGAIHHIRFDMKQIILQNNLYLVKLDKRSGETVNHFSHRVDAYKLKDAKNFLNWAVAYLGNFNLWNHYLSERFQFGYVPPNWVVRYQEPSNEFTEFFIHKDSVPFVMLHWKDNG